MHQDTETLKYISARAPYTLSHQLFHGGVLLVAAAAATAAGMVVIVMVVAALVVVVMMMATLVVMVMVMTAFMVVVMVMTALVVVMMIVMHSRILLFGIEICAIINGMEFVIHDYEYAKVGDTIGLTVDPYEIHLMKVEKE